MSRAAPWRLLACLLVAGVLALPLRGAKGQDLVADLSEHLVAITTGFAGAEVLLFGAVEHPGDIVVVVRGPRHPVRMHRKSRVFGIWMNTATMTFAAVPSYYAVSASDDLDAVTRESVRARHDLGLAHLDLTLPTAKASPNVAAAWRAALIRAKQREGHYYTQVGRVSFLGQRLFRTQVRFPANVPTGRYIVEVFYLRDGRVIAAQATPLQVGKVGTEAEIFDFAYNRSLLYGLIAIAIALMAGWLANLMFRQA